MIKDRRLIELFAYHSPEATAIDYVFTDVIAQSPLEDPEEGEEWVWED